MHDQYYSGDIVEQIKSKGYAGVIPDDPLEQILLFKKLQQIDEEISIKHSETQKKSEKSKNNNLILNQYDKDKLIINIEILGWKGHENYSMEQLMDLNEAIDNYFTIYDYCNQYGIWITPKSLKKYTLENLKQINQEFEKKVLNKEVRKKRTKKIEWENKAITNPKDIDKIKIRKQIKEFLTVDISEIHNNDLNSLKNKIDKLKIIEPNIKVSSLKNATLLLLNYEIESYDGEKESNIDDARKSINCHKSKIIIKEKYPEMDLPENCDDIIKIFNKKIVPKDFPDMMVTQEKIDQWKQEIKNKEANSGDMLYENSNKDIK
jgi:hypothetical protein